MTGDKKRTLARIIGGSVVTVVVWFGLTHCLWRYAGWKWQDAGVIGDSFGAVNALFSGLALAGVVMTLYLQSRDMKIATQSSSFRVIFDILQDHDLREHRKHLYRNCKRGMEWTLEQDRLAADEVCKSFNTVAILCQEKYVDLKVVLAVWSGSIVKCRDICTNFVADKRGEIPGHWEAYDWLVAQAKATQP